MNMNRQELQLLEKIGVESVEIHVFFELDKTITPHAARRKG